MNLEEILRQANKEYAARTLRRVFDPTNNLTISEVKRALQMDFIAPFIEELSVTDIYKPGSKSLQAVANKAKAKLRKKRMLAD